MKVGVETVTWGIRLHPIEKILDLIAEAGYQGVEIAQRFDSIGVRDIDHLLNLLSRRNLRLTGLVGGTLAERIAFCRTACVDYLYVEPWELPKLNTAIEKGFRPALHPRIFSPVSRSEDIIRVLDQYPLLSVILDTAHTTIAGENPADLVEKLRDRIVAIHLKDWTPEFGRSSYRYARGFTELGTGSIDLTTVLAALRRIDYKGWVISEIDGPRRDPADSVTKCAQWLAQKNLIARANNTTACAAKSPGPVAPRLRNIDATREVLFHHRLMEALTDTPDGFYQSIALAFNDLIPAKLVRVWTYSPIQNYMALLAASPSDAAELSDEQQFSPSDLLTGIAMHRHSSVTWFDLDQEFPAASYGFPDLTYRFRALKQRLGIRHIFSLPVYNSGNQNYVRMLINVAPADGVAFPADDELFAAGTAITQAADIMLDQLCLAATTRVNLLAGPPRSLGQFVRALVRLVRGTIQCEGVSIFLADEGNERMLLVATTGFRWLVGEAEHFYRRNEGITGRVWARAEPYLTVNALTDPHRVRKSDEQVSRPNHFGVLLVPLVDATGTAIGVVRCRNKTSRENTIQRHMFSEDDAAVLDAICQAAVPHLQRFRSEEQRRKTVERLTHELSVPVVAIRGAAQRMLRTPAIETVFDENYPADVWSWSELMRALLVKSNIFRTGSGGIQLEIRRPVRLMADIVAPAVRQVEMYLRERAFSKDRISYGRFENVPPLWVDQTYFQQIIFNLLSNAIKYAYNDPEAFRVEINGDRAGGMFEIRVTDWGIGINPEYLDAVFQEGFRSPQAKKRDIRGDGLGLWIVRRLVAAHGGTVSVITSHLPTEISVMLPDFLAGKPPTKGPRRRLTK